MMAEFASARLAGAIRPARAPGTASSTRRRPRGRGARQVRRARLLRRALRHRRDQLDLLRRARRRRRRRGWAERTPAGFEFSLKLFQKFTHPDMFQKAPGGDPLDLGQKDVDEFRRAIDPLAAAGKLGALLAQFPASFTNEPDTRGYLEWLLEQFKDYPRRRRAAASQLERQPGARRSQLLEAFGAAWAQIDEPKFKTSIRQDLLPERPDVLLPAAARPQRRAVVDAREVRGPLQLSVFGRRAEAVRRGGRRGRRGSEEGVSLRQQSLLGEVGGQRGDPQAPARAAAARRIPGGVRRALSGPEGPGEDPAADSLIPSRKPS